MSLNNIPAISKLIWLLNTVSNLIISAVWLNIKHIQNVVTILPVRSRKVGITKYIIAVIKRHAIVIACAAGLTTLCIKKSVVDSQ